MIDIATSSATALAEALRRREISSLELLDFFANRISRLDGPLNSVVTLDLERARRSAKEADEELARGDIRGPLHGLPITVKDSLETAGLLTTSGFPDLSAHVPAADAVCVARAVAAGAIVFGKTNLPTLAADVQTYNSLFGTTNNPWNLERTCGGSSGGSATATAAGFTSFEIGSDIGGSIRTPSNWCGVFGHKPTHDIIPQRGHIPGPPGSLTEWDLAVVGPIARSADDLELVLGIQAGPLPDRARGWRLDLPPPRREKLSDYRVAAWLDDDAFPVDPGVRTVLAGAVQALRSAGASVDEGARPAFRLADVFHTYLRLLAPVMLAGLPRDQFEMMKALSQAAPEDTRDPSILMARHGTGLTRDWLAANEARQHIRAAFADFFTRYDVLLTCVTPVTAVAHDHSDMPSRTIRVGEATRPYFDLLSWISPATCALLPATVAPVGLARDGMPVGVQIVGPYLEDRTTIDFARHVAAVTGGFKAPPLPA
ncbi:MAG TPA: amidase [Candidatus Binatia bacterium]